VLIFMMWMNNKAGHPHHGNDTSSEDWMEAFMTLVVGSTGVLGSEICHQLAVQGFPIRAMVRQDSDPGRVDRLKKYGAVLVTGDLRDLLSLDAACEDAHAVICTASALNSYQVGINDFRTVDLQGVTNLIAAAKQADVAHFIYISIYTSPRLDIPLQSIKRTVEQRLIASGMMYTILRPRFIMETWLPPIPDVQEGRVRGYRKTNQRIRWISVRDVAYLAVESLQKPAAWNATLDVGSYFLSSQSSQSTPLSSR
jgi:uncharacterized protein YbjT (DUF2867 family)